MTPAELTMELQQRVRAGGGLWLFLDYDGTLVPIARTPDEAQPDAALLDLLHQLAHTPTVRVAIVSGRSLATLQSFLPVAGVILAGLYGTEVQWADGTQTRRAPPEARETIEEVKAAWAELTMGRPGFLLEDKGLSIALHARWAEPADAERVLPRALAAARAQAPSARFRILGGDRFLEVAPRNAHKGEAVAWLMEQLPLAGALPVYFGDDDKDEEAFAVIRERGGLPVVVGPPRGPTVARVRLATPEAARRVLSAVLHMEHPHA